MKSPSHQGSLDKNQILISSASHFARGSKYLIILSIIMFNAGCKTMNHDKINLDVTKVGICNLPKGFELPNAIAALSKETIISYNHDFGLPIVDNFRKGREIIIYSFNAKVSEVYIIPYGFDHGSHLGIIRLKYDTGYLHNEEYEYKGDCTIYRAKSDHRLRKTFWTHNLNEQGTRERKTGEY